MTDEGHQGLRLKVPGAHPQVLGDAQPWMARVVRPRAQGCLTCSEGGDRILRALLGSFPSREEVCGQGLGGGV